ncbi:hypothetical protein D0962_22885 [Leptolyngbyaceae cyanobacterium CCMR0082]|uniref:Uncharacterized protein n=1 Tax=Adonisia turfae CCMR0082 TaxID=2304604 RepID=A0A6M0SB87_9CYAN|nr:hypothetical protein [Adonisia turfae]NEZ65566.1 hypothetical protein [Adonisia turfae CCMR0082]
MAGRIADAGARLRQQDQVRRSNAAFDRSRAGNRRGQTPSNIRRVTGQNRSGGLANFNAGRLRERLTQRLQRSPDVWTRRGARTTAQTRLRDRAAAGNAPQIVRNPRTGRRMAVRPNQGVLARG